MSSLDNAVSGSEQNQTTNQLTQFDRILARWMVPIEVLCAALLVGIVVLLFGGVIARYVFSRPVGWIDAAGDGELGIALRCGQINGDTIRIFAGCGIVDGSDPEIELAETYAKFSPMRSALK
jgi:hypothetical protein